MTGCRRRRRRHRTYLGIVGYKGVRPFPIPLNVPAARAMMKRRLSVRSLPIATNPTMAPKWLFDNGSRALAMTRRRGAGEPSGVVPRGR